MKVKFDADGAKRKDLAKAIADVLGVRAKYMGMPSAAYEAGSCRILKDGTVEIEDPADRDRVLAAIEEAGFSLESKESSDEESFQGQDLGGALEIPLDRVNTENLTRLLEAKGALIKKALGTEEIRFEIKEDRVAFPWFSGTDAEHMASYTKFIEGLCRMSTECKRITAKEKDVDNEKYAFRCFLLRLGFIGADYKRDRKILLENLTGSSAFRDGGAGHEISE